MGNGDGVWENLRRRPYPERYPHPLDTASAGKTILLTGAGGSIGSALAKAIAAASARLLILLDHSESNLHQIHAELTATAGLSPHIAVLGDICDGPLLAEMFDTYRPEVIYHLAAFKHVPLMEFNPVAAVRNNVLGTSVLAQAALEHEVAQLTMISTDKAVNPQSVMGATKRVAELVLLRWAGTNNQMKAVRLGNVRGSHGSVIPVFLRQISQGGPVTVTHSEVSRYFLTLDESVALILALDSLGGSGIFIPAVLGTPVRIADLAAGMIRNAGSEPGRDIEIVFTGLRPGDKIAEQFSLPGEFLEPTSDSRLLRASGREISPQDLDAAMEELSGAVRRRDVNSLIEVLCRIVPEYRPSETVMSMSNCSPA